MKMPPASGTAVLALAVFLIAVASTRNGLAQPLLGGIADSSSGQNTLSIGQHFDTLVVEPTPAIAQQSLDYLKTRWTTAFVPLALEALTYSRSPVVRDELTHLVITEIGSTTPGDINQWYPWI
jgi:hypothetical protein